MSKLLLWLKNHFIPHEGNEYSPHLLRHNFIFSTLLIVLFIESLFLVQALIVFNKTDLLAQVLPAVLTSLTNQERKDNNVGLLTQNNLLEKAAQMKAEDMSSRGYFSHVSPDGKSPWYWFDKVGYNYSYAGENLAVNFFESSDVAKAWMNSPSHRANIIKKDFKEIGIGVAYGRYDGHDTVFVAQFFGTPASASAPAGNTTPSKNLALNTPKSKEKQIIPTETKVLGEETTSSDISGQKVAGVNSVRLFIDKILTSPRQYSNYIYAGIVFIFSLAILLAVFIKSEVRHPRIIIKGLILLIVIFLLLFVNMGVIDTKTEIGESGVMSDIIAN